MSVLPAYFAVLKRWIDAHPEVNWQWHHLPLTTHEPAATANARLVECVGEAGGLAAFWQAVEWVYAHTRGDGPGPVRGPAAIPASRRRPAVPSDSDAPAADPRAVASAAQEGIKVTPRCACGPLVGKTLLLLHGPSRRCLCCRPSTCWRGGTSRPH